MPIVRLSVVNRHLRANARNGLYLDVSPGPIFVRGGVIRDNWEHGIKGALVENVTLDGTRIFNNGIKNRDYVGGIKYSEIFAALDVGYRLGRELTNWATGQSYRVILKNWTMQRLDVSNSQEDRDVDSPLINVFLPDDVVPTGYSRSWREIFLSSFSANYNRYHHANTVNAFTIEERDRTFCDWRAITGQDLSSSYRDVSCATAPNMR